MQIARYLTPTRTKERRNNPQITCASARQSLGQASTFGTLAMFGVPHWRHSSLLREVQTDFHGVSSGGQHRRFQLFSRDPERLDPDAHFTGIMDIDVIVAWGGCWREFIADHSFFSRSDDVGTSSLRLVGHKGSINSYATAFLALVIVLAAGVSECFG